MSSIFYDVKPRHWVTGSRPFETRQYVTVLSSRVEISNPNVGTSNATVGRHIAEDGCESLKNLQK